MLIFWTLAIALVTAVACSICGVFLVVKREAFVSEGLAHAVLPGIVLAFVIFRDRSSLGLILAAGLSGLLMIWLVRLFCSSHRVYPDAALGIVFSALFSGGIILSNMYLRNTHFHAECIIDGNLAFAPMRSFSVGDYYLGPRAFVTMTAILIVLLAFITIFFKVLKLAAFDPSLAYLLGFRPSLVNLISLSLVSITAVAAFETAGTVLVVALMICPAASSNLWTNSLTRMLCYAVAIGSAASIGGVFLGIALDIAPAGPIASLCGMLFLISVAVTATSTKNPPVVEPGDSC